MNLPRLVGSIDIRDKSGILLARFSVFSDSSVSLTVYPDAVSAGGCLDVTRYIPLIAVLQDLAKEQGNAV